MEEMQEWSEWLAANTSQRRVDDDFGLAKIAQHFGKSEAVETYWEGAATEENGDVESAIKLYKRAFHLWPALDSVTYGGLPRGVREEAEASTFPCYLMDIIDVPQARASQVMRARGLLNAVDIRRIEEIRESIVASESLLVNNPQNVTHKLKVGTFLNNPPNYVIQNQSPEVVGKMLRFAMQAWAEANWSGDAENPGPLYAVSGGVPSLSIRVVEHWHYQVGGGLVDPFHYDVDSMLTIVALLSEDGDFEGGAFRTYEPNGEHLEHPMGKGDVICFVSHKYHNITPITKGTRRSMVIELWQGGVGHQGR